MAAPDHKVNVNEAKILLSLLNSIDLHSPAAHQDVILKCQSLINTLQKPGDKALETFTSFTIFPCLCTANDLGLFERLSKGTLTAHQLAEQTGADQVLIVRLMRIITGAGIVSETGPQSYAPTPISNLYATPAFAAGFRMFGTIADRLSRFPQYLKTTNYRNPEDTENGIFQYCFGTDLRLFEWLEQNPDVAHNFNLFQTTQRSKQHWTDIYPVQSQIIDNVTIQTNTPLVVDVGGGMGHDLRTLKNKLPSVSKGQLVLEDQASVIDTIPAEMHDADVEYVKYDFFTPQPVKGARVYILKSIVHNWPDDKVVEILRNVAAGMTPGYSKVWLFGGIVPKTDAPRMLAGMDVVMMVLLAAMERTRQHMSELLEKAGLAVTNVQTIANGYGVIEAMIRD